MIERRWGETGLGTLTSGGRGASFRCRHLAGITALVKVRGVCIFKSPGVRVLQVEPSVASDTVKETQEKHLDSLEGSIIQRFPVSLCFSHRTMNTEFYRSVYTFMSHTSSKYQPKSLVSNSKQCLPSDSNQQSFNIMIIVIVNNNKFFHNHYLWHRHSAHCTRYLFSKFNCFELKLDVNVNSGFKGETGRRNTSNCILSKPLVPQVTWT